jgi:hypothetical protein
MCFSATASFTAAAVLIPTGIYATRAALIQNRSYLLFGLTPIIFGIQQFIEGGIWLSLQNQQILWAHSLSYAYTFFAFLWWPFWLNLCLYRLEQKKWQKIFIIFGVLVGAIIYGSALMDKTFGAAAQCYSIMYLNPENMLFYIVFSILYLLVSTSPFLFSKNRDIQIFGALMILSFVATYVFYKCTFASVWCFAGAIISLWIVHMIRSSKKAKFCWITR